MFMKLNKTKASPDGITPEVLQNIADQLVNELCDFLNIHDDDPLRPLPEELIESEYTFIYNRAVPTNTKHLRPIAGLHAMRYRWLQEAIVLEFGSFQTGFVQGRQAGESTWAVRRVLELANELGNEVLILQILNRPSTACVTLPP